MDNKPKTVFDTILMYLASGIAVPGYVIGNLLRHHINLPEPYYFIDGCILAILGWIIGLIIWFHLEQDTRDEIFNLIWRLLFYIFIIGLLTFLAFQLK